MIQAIYSFKEKRQELDAMVDAVRQTDQERQNKIFSKVFEVDQRIEQMEK